MWNIGLASRQSNIKEPRAETQGAFFGPSLRHSAGQGFRDEVFQECSVLAATSITGLGPAFLRCHLVAEACQSFIASTEHSSPLPRVAPFRDRTGCETTVGDSPPGLPFIYRTGCLSGYAECSVLEGRPRPTRRACNSATCTPTMRGCIGASVRAIRVMNTIPVRLGTSRTFSRSVSGRNPSNTEHSAISDLPTGPRRGQGIAALM